MSQLNKWQKELQALQKANYQKTDNQLFNVYRQSLIDIKKRLKVYTENAESLSFSTRLEVERLFSVADEINGILQLNSPKVEKTIKGYSAKQAEQGYYGLWYTLEQSQNVALSMPLINHDYIMNLVNAPVAGKRLSKRLYKYRDELAQNVTNNIITGLFEGKSYAEIARRINEETEASYKQALRIARTEAGRTQSTTTQKGYEEAKELGINIKKKWLATIDKHTRRTHQELDGKEVDVDEEFTIRGHSAKGPRMFGVASEDVNCRCTTIEVVDGISPELRKDNESKEMSEFKSYDDWLASRLGNNSPEGIIRNKLNNIDMSKATKDDIIELGSLINQHYQIDKIIGDKQRLKDTFSLFRKMGGEIPSESWAKGSEKKAKEQLNNAFSYYPKNWADLLARNDKKLFSGVNKRGFFFNGLLDKRGRYKTNIEGFKTDFVTIHLSGRATTPFHEIGHLIECFNPDVVRIEKEFIEARTRGEIPTRLSEIFPGSGYSNREVTKKDNFISPYIGKVYPNATEVLSVGLESLFEPQGGQLKSIINGRPIKKYITDDEEFLNLVIGLILKG
ncbi:phage head morphogenesis protein [Enterococcus faecalis]|uniref:phage head morphogenesis protein n=1 Tax=Enterococcus sp. FR128 TaxID=2923500 RepID=UPI00280FA6E9|nr:phage minor head protein [Enterococcus sp. FR128]MDQ8673500.1 phage minor head protein [Enterococcus sp. FR128]